MKAEHDQDSRRTWRLLLRLTLFLMVPLCVCGYLGFFAVDLEESYRRQRARRQLERDLDDWVQRIDPEGTVRLRFQQFAAQLDEDQVSERRIEWLMTVARQKWGLNFEPYVFDADGKLLAPRNLNLRNRPVFQRLWSALEGDPLAIEEADRYRRPLQALLGYEFRLRTILGLSGVLHPIRSQGRDGYLFWTKLRRSGAAGVILVCWSRPSHLELLQHSLQQSTFHRYAILMEERDGRQQVLGRPFPGNREELLKQSGVFGHPWYLSQGWQWASSMIGDSRLVIGVPAPDLTMTQVRQRLWIMLLLIGGCGFWLFHGWFFRGRDLYLSLRVKTLLFFSLAVFAPLMGILFLAFQTVNLRRQILEDRIEREAREQLLALDASFPGSIETYRRFCLETRQRWITNFDRDAMQKELQKLISERQLVHAEARDLNGDMLLKQMDNRFFEGMESTMNAIAKMCIERNLAQKRKSLALSVDMLDTKTREVLQNRQTGFPKLIAPGEVQNIRFGATEFLYFWDTVDSSQVPIAYILLVQSLAQHAPGYLHELLLKNRKYESDMLRIFARSEISGQWYPADEAMGGRLDQFMERLRISGRALCDTVFWQGKRYYAVGFPGRNFEDVGLLALSPERLVTDELRQWHARILAGVVAVLIVAFFTAQLLWREFLTPMRGLSTAMAALRAHSSDTRVEIRTGDELEKLGHAFNRLIGDLKEMELARVVQTALIPQRIPEIPGYEVAIESAIARNLGGDYCDVLPMRDGRFLLVMGDVSGHGVSSALLMAMAKAVAFDYADSGTEPAELLRQMNRLVFQLMNRRKLMTYFAGMLEPGTGHFQFSNAGHPFPLKIMANGLVEELALVHLPLGLLERREAFQVQETVIPPGAFLLLYTDGLVEMTDETGQQYGYERLAEAVAVMKGRAAGVVVESLRELYLRYHGRRELDDDVTFLALARSEPTESCMR
ncbi:MAG TPA: SpoIIE family protein phosphatase [Candidatus Ozemobacteraceae bacterium]|nr:SpoIIE family protein phosphatase [Candidatus Ozemobacteraceae bacterium]